VASKRQVFLAVINSNNKTLEACLAEVISNLNNSKHQVSLVVVLNNSSHNNNLPYLASLRNRKVPRHCLVEVQINNSNKTKVPLYSVVVLNNNNLSNRQVFLVEVNNNNRIRAVVCSVVSNSSSSLSKLLHYLAVKLSNNNLSNSKPHFSVEQLNSNRSQRHHFLEVVLNNSNLNSRLHLFLVLLKVNNSSLSSNLPAYLEVQNLLLVRHLSLVELNHSNNLKLKPHSLEDLLSNNLNQPLACLEVLNLLKVSQLVKLVFLVVLLLLSLLKDLQACLVVLSHSNRDLPLLFLEGQLPQPSLNLPCLELLNNKHSPRPRQCLEVLLLQWVECKCRELLYSNQWCKPLCQISSWMRIPLQWTQDSWPNRAHLKTPRKKLKPWN